MRYIRDSFASTLPPKLLGTYELEIQGAVAEIVAAAPEAIVDVGAAEGYYVVGLARAVPSCRVVAFEAESRGRDLLARMAALNGVAERVDIRGLCDAGSLRACLNERGRAAVIMDIEGGEKDVLDPALIPQLRACDILVEVHEGVHAGLGALLRGRFAATHTIREIREAGRRPSDFPFPRTGWRRAIPESVIRRCLDEKRALTTDWLFMRPRDAESSRTR